MPHGSQHSTRKDLAGENPLGDRLQIVLMVSFFIVWGLDSFVFQFSTFLSAYFPAYIQLPASIFVLVAAGYIAWKAHQIVFGEIRDPPAVIEKSVFSKCRHPMYLGSILVYVGLCLTSLSLLSIIFIPIAVVFYDRLARDEEVLLEEKYGQAYRDYMSRVPRWL